MNELQTTTAGDVLPHDLEAERAVLGAIMLRNDRIEDVAAVLSPEDFYRRGHRDTFTAMLTLAKRGMAIDFVTLRNELATFAKLEADDPVYISALADGQTKSTNARHYADIVRQKAAERQAVQLCRQTIHTVLTHPAALGNGLPAHHREAWDRIVTRATAAGNDGLPEEDLADAVDVSAEGRRIESEGIPQLLQGVIPFLGMLGFLVAYAKVGKTTFGLALAAAVAMSRDFLDRTTMGVRVLVLCAEDPPEYTAWAARHLDVDRRRMTFYRKPIVLTPAALAQIVTTVKRGDYGMVLISSFQAVVRGLVNEENDNAGMVRVVEDIKAAARATGVPWLIDAHSGKGEDQDDDADPSRAMRGASAAAGAADFTLSLRYANGAFGTQRRLSGKGRFVSFEPMLMEFDPKTSTYTVIASTKDAMTETTWRLITEANAITTEPRTAGDIARGAGLVDAQGKVSNTQKRQVALAVSRRPDVGKSEELRQGKKATLYRLLEGANG